MSARKVASGAFVGLLAGVAIGILMAPAKGTVTRRKVGREVRKVKRASEKQLQTAKDFAGDKYDEAKSYAGEKYEKTRNYAKGASRKAKSDIKELNKASEPLRAKFREIMENASDEYSAQELDKLAKKAEKAIDDVSKKIEKQAEKK